MQSAWAHYDDRPRVTPSGHQRALWMVESVLSRRLGLNRGLTARRNSSLPDEPVKMAMGPVVPYSATRPYDTESGR